MRMDAGPVPWLPLSFRAAAAGTDRQRRHTWKASRSWRSRGTSFVVAPKMNMLSNPISSPISMLAPSSVPMMRLPFMANFMLDVPDASVPAVLMCCDSSVPAPAYVRISKGQIFTKVTNRWPLRTANTGSRRLKTSS